MINSIFVTRPNASREVEISYFNPKSKQQRTMKFFENQDGTKFTCDMYCRVLDRGHTHLVTCNHTHTRNQSSEGCPYDNDLSFMAMGRRHNTSLGDQSKNRHIDEVRHDKYWELSGFVDPTKGKEFVSDQTRKNFNKCRVISKHVNYSSKDSGENLCNRHVNHDLLDVYSPTYLEDVSLLAERFPSGGFSPSGHHFSYSYAYHHYILIDCSKNMLENDIIPSMKLFQPQPNIPNTQPTPEEFLKLNNRMGFTCELILRYLHIRYKLNPQDKFTVLLFNKKQSQVLIEDESTVYYYSFIDLMLYNCKPNNSTKYKNGFDKLLELLEKHAGSNKTAHLQPKVVLFSGGKLEGRKRSASVSGTPRWTSIRSSSKSLKTAKATAETTLEKIISHLAMQHAQLYHSNNSYLTHDESSHFTIVKIGTKGNDSRLKEFSVIGRENITMIDSGLMHTQYMNDHNLEAIKAIVDDEDAPASSSKEVSLIKIAAMLTSKVIGNLLQPFEAKQCQLNENIKNQNGGLLVKTILHEVEERKKQDLSEAQIKSLTERENLAKEVLQTERTYITNLSKLIELYYYPLSKQLSNYMSESDRSKIFSGLLNIYKLHKTLMVQLEERLNEWSDQQKLADVFVELSPIFLLYTQFTTKYETAIETFASVRSNHQMNTFLYMRRKDPYTHGHTLNSFLIMPIQRIPRYKMLLEGILKHTSTDHPDYENLQKATSKMAEVADYLNEKIRERQNFHKMKLISQKISGVQDSLIQPNRRYLSEFFLRHKLNSQMMEDCVVFLFNDLIIHCVQKVDEDVSASSKKLSLSLSRKKMTKSKSMPNLAAMTNMDPNGNNDIDIMGILEDDTKGVTYEARFALPVAALQVHPIAFSSNSLEVQQLHRFQVQVKQQNQTQTVEYVVGSEEEKTRVLTKLNEAIQKASTQIHRN